MIRVDMSDLAFYKEKPMKNKEKHRKFNALTPPHPQKTLIKSFEKHSF